MPNRGSIKFVLRHSPQNPIICGTCIICHGSSDSRAIRNALRGSAKLSDRDINSKIVEQLREPMDDDGQIFPAHSISAGLDYPGVGPEHAHLKEIGRAEYMLATDEEALEAFQVLSRTEGIIPALESAHAIAYAMKLAATMDHDEIILVNLSGRGDKDVDEVRKILAERKAEGRA